MIPALVIRERGNEFESMSWERLATRLNKLPLVLAGPILRRVSPTSATVWVVTFAGADATLKVMDDKGVEVARGKEHTVAFGSGLHIIAVTAAILDAAKPLVEGVVYQYDIDFVFDGNVNAVKLAEVADIAKLSYLPWKLPSFSLPPKDLTKLRLLQGSCRKAAADGVDMMPGMDDLITPSAGDAYARPHQLLLTGDQIYADDVADGLRLMITDAASTLLGWEEMLPMAEAYGGRRKAGDIHAARRWLVLWNRYKGFTSDDKRSHLMSLGEYICMYLFGWSPVLWPPSLPTTQDVIDEFSTDVPPELNVDSGHVDQFIFGISKITEWGSTKSIDEANKSLAEFRTGLEKVRRVLANVPTYMVFDDHDITDDWNMTRKFCKDVYGNDLLLRVVQNALVAYNFCQHWGNVPDEFRAYGNNERIRPGYLLRGLVGIPNVLAPNALARKAQDYQDSSKGIQSLVGIPAAKDIAAQPDRSLRHEPGAMRYDFSIVSPGHHILFTDTRSWRAFPDDADGTHLLTKNDQLDQYKEQITDSDFTGDRLLFVVLTTNAPPVQPIRAATRHDTLTHTLATVNEDLYEAWDLPSVGFNRLLVALTNKLPEVSGQHTGAVVLISGDVHHSFATRMVYRATRRFEDGDKDTRASAVIAQLVGSSFKKQNYLTVVFQRDGYFAVPKPAAGMVVRHARTEGYVGWSFPAGDFRQVASWGKDGKFSIKASARPLDLTLTEPITGTPDPRTISVNVKPHYRLRLDYLLPALQVGAPPVPLPIALPPFGNSEAERKEAAKAYDKLLERAQIANRYLSPTVVGLNNFAEIRITGSDATTRKVHHIVYWTEPETATVSKTTYIVRLDVNAPNDPEFPDIRAPVEPP
jgi:hypothetical protein